MRRFLVVIMILVGLLVGGDFLVRNWAEARAASHLQDRLALDGEPEVSLGGWPFLIDAVDSRFKRLAIKTGPLARDRARFSDVHIDLTDVHVSLEGAIRGDADSVRHGGGSGRLFFSGTWVSSRLARGGAEDVSVSFEGNDMLVSSPRIEGASPGSMEVQDDVLVLGAEALGTSFRIGLPSVIDGLSYDGAAVREGEGTVSFTLEPGRLRAPE